MNHRYTWGWSYWVGVMTAGNVFVAMLAARELSAFQAWRIAFWPSAVISALTAIAIGFFVTIACKKLERARLLGRTKIREYETISEEREYIQKAATDLSELMQRPFEPRDRKGKKKEPPLVAEIKTKRAKKRSAATNISSPATDEE